MTTIFLLDGAFGMNLQSLFAGDVRAEDQPALTSMPSLFLNNHNRIAKLLKKNHPDWDNDQLFNYARKINIADFQNVVYKEYLPVVLGQQYIDKHPADNLQLPNPGGPDSRYDQFQNTQIYNEFATVAYRYGHTLIPRVWVFSDKPEVHTPAPNFRCPMRFAYFNPSKFNIGVDDSGKGWHNLLLGITETKSKDFNAKVEDSASNFLYCSGEKQCDVVRGHGQDLAARNIQRGRDHGIPGYTEFRKYCNLSVPTSFDDNPRDFNISQQNWDNMKSVYEKVEDIDAFTGGVSEDNLDPDGLVGETFACIIGKQFKNLKNGDRFFFTHGVQEISPYAQGLETEVKDSILKRGLSDIICDNIPTLDKITKNVFRTKSEEFDCKEDVSPITLP